jgi:integrase
LTVPLNDTVADMLRNEAPGIGRVFPWGSKNSIYRVLKPLCEKTGIHFTPHMARHSFATWHDAAGGSTKEIMEAGVWLDPKSVLRYTHVDQRRVRATLNCIRI